MKLKRDIQQLQGNIWGQDMFNGVKMVLIKHFRILLRDADADEDVVQKYLQDSVDVGLMIGQGVFCIQQQLQ